MRQFHIPLPRSMQSASIMSGTNFITKNPPLDGYVGFGFVVVRALPDRPESRIKPLVALVQFDRDLELDESVLLRLKYDAKPFEFDPFSNLRRFNIAAPESAPVEEKDDDYSSL